MRINNKFQSVIGSGFLVLISQNSFSEVVTDGSSGQAYNIASMNGTYQISEQVGTLRGNNLFHSFSTFSLGSQETAVFTGSSQISNVISRVTGDQVSTIDGVIRSEIPGANFWFINPNGILFGENAKIDVNGSFFVSTADYLTFADGSELAVSDQSNDQIFSMAEPKSFGFMDAKQSSVVISGSQLDLGDDNNISIAAENISISSAKIEASNIQLVSAHQDSFVNPNEVSAMTFDVNTAENIQINNSAIVSLGQNAQSIYIIAGNLVIDNSIIEQHSKNNENNDSNTSNLGIKAENVYIYDSQLAVYTENEKINHIYVEADKKLDVSGSQILVESYKVQGNIYLSAQQDLELAKNSSITVTGTQDSATQSFSKITINGLLDIEPSVSAQIQNADLTGNYDFDSGKQTRDVIEFIAADDAKETDYDLLHTETEIPSQPCVTQQHPTASYFYASGNNVSMLMPVNFNPGATYASKDILYLDQKVVDDYKAMNRIGLYNQCG